MHFQNHGCLRGNGAGIIGQTRFVRRSDLAQRRAGRFQNLAHTKTATDLDELAARDDDLQFSLGEMMDDENERSRAIVHHAGGFGLTESRERTLKILAASATHTRVQIEFQIVIGAASFEQCVQGLRCERYASEIGVNNDAGAVDYRLQTAAPKPIERSVHSLDRIPPELFRTASLCEFLSNRLNNQRAWQIGSRNLFQHFADRWNLPARSHETTRISGSLRRVIRPMIA